jgi:hypothetical protein
MINILNLPFSVIYLMGVCSKFLMLKLTFYILLFKNNVKIVKAESETTHFLSQTDILYEQYMGPCVEGKEPLGSKNGVEFLE